jgi:hypothetical protein
MKNSFPDAFSAILSSMKFKRERWRGRSRILFFINRKNSSDVHSVEESIGRALIRRICKKKWMNSLVPEFKGSKGSRVQENVAQAFRLALSRAKALRYV